MTFGPHNVTLAGWALYGLVGVVAALFVIAMLVGKLDHWRRTDEDDWL
jgi:hypothetical protein